MSFDKKSIECEDLFKIIDEEDLDKCLRNGYKGYIPIYAWFDGYQIVEGMYEHELPERDDFGRSVIEDANNKNYRQFEWGRFKNSGSHSVQIIYKDFRKIYDIKNRIEEIIEDQIDMTILDRLNDLKSKQVLVYYDDDRSPFFNEKGCKLLETGSGKYQIIFWDRSFEIFLFNIDSYLEHTKFRIVRDLNISNFNEYRCSGFERLRTEDIWRLWKNKSHSIEYLYPREKGYFKCLVEDDKHQLPIMTTDDLYILHPQNVNASQSDEQHKRLSELGKEGGRKLKRDENFQLFIDNEVKTYKRGCTAFVKMMEDDYMYTSAPASDNLLYEGLGEICADLYLLGDKIHYTSDEEKKSMKIGTIRNYFTEANKKLKKQNLEK